MAITLRNVKGSPISSVEYDDTISQLFYSASFTLSNNVKTLYLHYTGSVSPLNYAPRSISIPFNDYQYWRITDGTNSENITNTFILTFSGSNGITPEYSAADNILSIDHDSISRTNNTSTANPSPGGTFTAIDSITTNDYGHVTAVNTKTVTLPVDVSSSLDAIHEFTASAENRLDALEIVTGSYATTGSNTFTGDQIIQGTLTAINSNTFGDDISDKHEFTGSVDISGSITADTFIFGGFGALSAAAGTGLIYNVQIGSEHSHSLDISRTDGTSYTIFIDTGSFGAHSGSISTRLTDLEAASGSFSTRITDLEGITIISSSAEGSAQGTIALNGNDVNVKDMQTNDSPTFAGLTVTGTLTTTELVTNIVSSSVTLATGSNIFGDQLTDEHQFTGSLDITGSAILTGTVTSDNFITTSDRRLKSEIIPIQNSLDKIKKFVSYEYIKNGEQDAGFIAQEVQEVLPYSVGENKEGYLTMKDRPILAHIHKALIELEERVSVIEQKLG